MNTAHMTWPDRQHRWTDSPPSSSSSSSATPASPWQATAAAAPTPRMPLAAVRGFGKSLNQPRGSEQRERRRPPRARAARMTALDFSTDIFGPFRYLWRMKNFIRSLEPNLIGDRNITRNKSVFDSNEHAGICSLLCAGCAGRDGDGLGRRRQRPIQLGRPPSTVDLVCLLSAQSPVSLHCGTAGAGGGSIRLWAAWKLK